MGICSNLVPGMRDKVTTPRDRALSDSAKARIVRGLRKGDQTLIADVVECSADYVKKTLRQKRADKSAMARRIWFTADRIIRDRAQLKGGTYA